MSAGAPEPHRTPSIGVAIPAYQAEPWLAETLESVLSQTSPPDEVLVVDNGSTDGTADVARSFGAEVRLLSESSNLGPGGAYNRAVRESDADYVATCPADDLWDPRKLELQRQALSARPDVDVVFSGARYFGLAERDFPRAPKEGVLDPQEFFREMYRVDLVAAPTVLVRRELFHRLGGFREDLAGEDYEFCLRALRSGAVFFHDPRQLVHLRQHGGNLSSKALLMWELNHQIHTLYAADLGDEDLAREVLARDLRKIGRCRLGLGLSAQARQAYRASLAQVAHPAALGWALALSLPGAHGLWGRIAAHRRGDPAGSG